MGRGVFMQDQWTTIAKDGSLAMDAGQIKDFLEDGGGEDVTLTRQELIERITNYFKSCMRETEDKETGEIINKWVRNPTKGGLAISIGVELQTLIDYVKGHDSTGRRYTDKARASRRVATEDFDVIRKAYALIEAFYEEKLALNRNNAGAIFWLVNSRERQWTNEHKVTVSNEQEKLEARTPEQIAEQYAEPLEGLPQMPDFPDTEESEE